MMENAQREREMGGREQGQHSTWENKMKENAEREQGQHDARENKMKENAER